MGALFHLESVMFELEICQIHSLLGWIERWKFFISNENHAPVDVVVDVAVVVVVDVVSVVDVVIDVVVHVAVVNTAVDML